MRHGGKAPAKMIRIGPPSPVPKHRAANGTQAIGGMKRRASNTGVTISSRVRDQPIRRPRGDAHRGAEEEAATEPEEAGCEVPGQGRAREGRREEVKEAGGELVRGGQELPRHGAGER